MTHSLRRTVAPVLLAALLTGLLLAGSAEAGGIATIKMVKDGKTLDFRGAKAVNSGKPLKIVNDTNPSKVGPHTFTLALGKQMPDSRQEEKKCFAPGGMCNRAVMSHEVNFKTGEVAKPVVDNAKKGWDALFSKKRNGDSWYTETEGEKHTRLVSAKPGSRLSYFCLVHPNMQGKINVK